MCNFEVLHEYFKFMILFIYCIYLLAIVYTVTKRKHRFNLFNHASVLIIQLYNTSWYQTHAKGTILCIMSTLTIFCFLIIILYLWKIGDAGPNCQKQTPWGGHEGPTSSSGTSAHSPAPSSWIDHSQRTPGCAGQPPAPRALCRWEQVHTGPMGQAWSSPEKLWWTLCCLQLHPAWPVCRWVLGGSHGPACHGQRYPDCC